MLCYCGFVFICQRFEPFGLFFRGRRTSHGKFMTNPKSNSTVISRIKKLLALAESSNPHEAESAQDLANKLLEKHGLTLKDIQETIDDGFSKLLIFERGTHLVRAEMDLAIIVAQFHDCVVVFKDHPKPEQAFAIGDSTKTVKVREQFLFLRDKLDQASLLGSRRRSRVNSKYWRRSFWTGALDALDKRFGELKQPPKVEEEAEEGGYFSLFSTLFKDRRRRKAPQVTALVKADQDEFGKAEDHVKELGVGFKEVTEDPGASIVDGEAYQMGYLFGDRMALEEDQVRQLEAGAEG